MKRRLPLVLLVVLVVVLASVGSAFGQTADPTLSRRPPDDVTDPPPLFTFDDYPASMSDNVVLQWDEELLQAVRALPPGPTVVARAINVVHTAIFDAWAAYDARARGTRLGTQLRRPAAERTLANKNKAISFAAYKTLVDLFPARRFDFDEQMALLGYAVDDWSLRVFLRRVWGSDRLAYRSWAVQPSAEHVASELWHERGAEVYDVSLATYADELTRLTSALVTEPAA